MKDRKQYKTERVAIDIEDFDNPRIYNALLANGASIYRTKRERKALLIKQEAFELLRVRMKFDVAEAQDGLVYITPIVAKEQVAA